MTACSQCSARADRWVGTQPFCRQHWLEFRQPLIDKHVLPEGGFNGVAIPVGRRRPEYGDDVYDVRCPQCSATWCGREGDPCGWCQKNYELLLETHRAVLARPDLPGVGDMRRQNAEVAWAKRLAQAVRAGIATEAEVRTWWNRTVKHVG